MTVKRIVLAAVMVVLLGVAAIVLLIAGLVMHHRVETRPPPNIDALKNVLEKSATTTLALPEIAEEKVMVAVPKEAIASETEKVVRLASECGGIGIKTINDGVAGVLVSVPVAQAGKFYQSATGRTLPPGGDLHDGKQDFDFVITPAVAASPSP